MNYTDNDFTSFKKCHLDLDKSLNYKEDVIYRKNNKILSRCYNEM